MVINFSSVVLRCTVKLSFEADLSSSMWRSYTDRGAAIWERGVSNGLAGDDAADTLRYLAAKAREVRMGKLKGL